MADVKVHAALGAYWRFTYLRNGIWDTYATVSIDTVNKAGGAYQWFVQNAVGTQSVPYTDNVYVYSTGELIYESPASAATRQAAAEAEAKAIQYEAEQKIAYQIAQTQGFTNMANSTTVSFASGTTRTDLVNVTEGKIDTLSNTVKAITDTANKQLSMVEVGKVFEEQTAERSKIAMWILLPVFAIILIYTLFKR